MQTVTDLIDAARKALNVSSDAEFARQLGVSRGTIANWKSGYSLPDTVMCATLAGLTGLPLARVLGIVGEARAVSREEKAVWRKLAATAMAVCLAVGFALPHKAQAAVSGFESAHAVYIMRSSIWPAQATPLGRFRRFRLAMDFTSWLRLKADSSCAGKSSRLESCCSKASLRPRRMSSA